MLRRDVLGGVLLLASALAPRRAEALGGTFTIRPGEPRGTVVDWVVPVDDPAGAQ